MVLNINFWYFSRGLKLYLVRKGGSVGRRNNLFVVFCNYILGGRWEWGVNSIFE